MTNTKLEIDFVSALKKEIIHRKSEVDKIETIYFGGGTPSIIQSLYIKEILDLITIHYVVAEDAEITLEANPDDLSEEHLQAFYKMGINRLSIGIQSFENEYLTWMNRSHTAEEALTVIGRAAQIGFKDFSIDLIYGIPGMDNQTWLKQIEIAASLGVNHLSCYCLTVEPKTPLEKLIQRKLYKGTDDEVQSNHFDLLMKVADEYGFEQYEISNFARNKHYSKHNTAYWQYKPYLGFGPSAHSFDGAVRRHHASSLSEYIKDPFKLVEEHLTLNEKFNEYILIGLRTMQGIDISKLEKKFGNELSTHFRQTLAILNNTSHFEIDSSFLRLTKAGRHYADSLAAEFFMI